MIRCTKCLYPETTKPFITFDDDGVCSGCRTHGEKEKVNWEEREHKLRALIDPYRSNDTCYDCIIPVSGGKDSTFQVHYAIKCYILNLF